MNKYLDFATEISKKGGQRLYKSFKTTKANKRGTSKEVKSVFDGVVDDLIKEGIKKEFPNHSYLTEESGLIDKNSDFLWVIDPLDGTGNYENHNPFFSVSVSLWKNNNPILGVIEAPALKERFVGIKGKGAYIYDMENGKKQELKVSNTEDLKKSYFVFCEGSEILSDRIVRNFKEVYSKTKDFRKIGSAALELSWIAAGRAEGYITYKIPIWDIAAGIIVLSEAGGELFNFNGDKIRLNDFSAKEKLDLLATNGRIPLNVNLQ